jgi:hypothetical protein
MGQLFSGDKRSENMDAGRESYAGISDDLQINNGAPLIDIYYDSKYRLDASFKHGGRPRLLSAKPAIGWDSQIVASLESRYRKPQSPLGRVVITHSCCGSVPKVIKYTNISCKRRKVARPLMGQRTRYVSPKA